MGICVQVLVWTFAFILAGKHLGVEPWILRSVRVYLSN